MKKGILSFILSIVLLLTGVLNITASDDESADIGTNNGADGIVEDVSGLEINARSAVLMEAKTGTILYSKAPNEPLPPASVTKVMTLLLVAEAIDNGQIKLEDSVTVSSNAAAMGGSQVFLKEGESFTVEELLKCTVIASANDAAVALAELVAGSESAFVSMMNKRCKELGMKSTYFENATGLDDTVQNHLTSAYDIAVMSRELLKHEIVRKYSNIWQDSIRNGEFILTNTNRLVRYYEGCTGLKTGSTDKAGFCISASASKGGMELIAVIMGSDTRDERNNAARTLLDFGFASFGLYEDKGGVIDNLPIYYGTKSELDVYSSPIAVLVPKADIQKVEKIYRLPEHLSAPINCGCVIGRVEYMLDGKKIGEADVYVSEECGRMGFTDAFSRIFLAILK